MKSLKDYIIVYENVLEPHLCDKVIEVFENSKHDIYTTDIAKFDHLDLNDNGLGGLSQALTVQAVPSLMSYIRTLNMGDHISVNAAEGFKLKKYDKNSDHAIKPHCDIWNKETSVRYLNFIYYLNDNNGFLCFPHLGLIFRPKKGSLIVFPPYWMFTHEAHNPTDVDKYIAISCLHYT